MLRLMRENAGSWIIKILLGIIVIVFVFLGIGPGDTKQENIAVTVNKKVVSMDEYRMNYNSLLNMYRQQFGNNLNDELIKMLGLKNKTLDNLIDKALILQEADKLSIDVSEDELIDEITSIKAFQKDGKFSSNTYNNYLKYSRQPADYFEAKSKEELIVKKVRSLITDTVRIAETEAKEWFLWEKASAKIDYVLFDPSSYEDLIPTNEEILDYYEKNKDQYKSERKMKVSYLNFSPEDYKKLATVSDNELKDYYEANITKYETEKTVSARHILIKVDENADEAIVENARIKAMDIYAKVTAGTEKFEDLAKKYSEGPSGKDGGNLGTFERGRMVKSFSDKAFSLAAGEIGEPVKTKFGWHIIKVETVNVAAKKQLAEVQDEIRNAMLKEKSENLAYDESEDVFTTIIGGVELKEVAETKNLKLVETKLFNKQGGPYEIPAAIRRDFADTAFTMALNEISDVIEFEGNYYIIQINDIKESSVQPLDMVKSQIEKAATKKMRADRSKKDATELLAALKDNSKKISEQKNVKTTGFFTRDKNSDDNQLDSAVTDAAFRLSTTRTLPDEVILGSQGYYVIILKERTKPEMTEFEKEKDRIEKQLLSKKQTKTFDNWLALLKSKSSIERNPRLVN